MFARHAVLFSSLSMLVAACGVEPSATESPAVLQGASTATTGTLTGVIFQNGDTNDRVSGATVKVGSATKTTDSTGTYQFVLAPGTYTVSVSKTGYSAASLSRTVTANTTIWGSMQINPVAATGKLKGKIYAYDASNPTDLSRAISGATVKVGTRTQTVGADGLYEFTLAPGTYTVTASAAGYQTNSLARTVVANADIWGSVGLSAVAAPDQQAPAVSISFPTDKLVTEVAVLDLEGTASDNVGAVKNVSVKLNGGTATSVPVTGGQFVVAIKLKPGANTVEVSAKDAAGNVGKDTVTATFRAGITGFVHGSDEEAAPVAAATVELLHPTTGDRVASATSNAEGIFNINLSDVGQDLILAVQATGFMSRSEPVTIPDDERLHLNIPLTAGEDLLPAEPAVNFMEPTDGAVVSSESVVVYGTVVGMDLASITVNGVVGEQLGAGGFAAVIPLMEGPNVIEAIAQGAAGESVSGKMTVTRRSSGTGTGVDPGDDPGAPGGPGGQVKKSGCAALPGLELWALTALLPLLRRRRKA